MKVALVYDRVNKFGGAERVMLALHNLFPDAPLFTLVHDPANSKWADAFTVIPTFLNSIPFIRSKHELLAPIAPLAFESFNFDKFDLVISVTSSDAKAVITKPNTMHVCYCLTPTRYFWSGKDDYHKDLKMKLLPKTIKKYLRTVDLLTSKRPDEYIAISNEVKDRISRYYNRDSVVIYPPIDDLFFRTKSTSPQKQKYYLVVSRLVPYKKVDLVIKVFNKRADPLLIIGSGSELARLRKLAKGNITFLENVDDPSLREHYLQAKAVIFPQHEDFGLVPLEAQACGTPVIAFGKGGALETVINGKTGLLFHSQSVASLSQAIEKFEKIVISPQDCKENAGKFSFSSFSKQLTGWISSHMENKDGL